MIAPRIDTDLLEQAVGRLPRDALTEVRRDALARFAETGFPTTRDEDWKYTNLEAAAALSNAWLHEAARPRADTAAADAARRYVAALAAQVDAYWIVIANGEVLQAAFALPGVAIDTGADASRSFITEDPMSRFNAALLTEVLNVRVAPGTTLAKPLGFLLFDDSGSGMAVSHPRILLRVGNGARAKIIEHHASAGSSEQFANAVAELDVQDGAEVDFVRIQDRDRRHLQVSRLHVRMARDARLNHAAFDLGGALTRNDVAVDIAGPGAAVTLSGLYLASGNQHVDNHTRIDHRVGPATSVQDYRGIASGRARTVWNGKAIVHKGADGTDARQANHNLLLSEKAEADTKPELEIYADDVKCSHGATVGQLDEEALFYLRSRGLSRLEAAEALTRAFAAAVTGSVPVAEAQALIDRLVEARLEGLIGPEPGSARTRTAGERRKEEPRGEHIA